MLVYAWLGVWFLLGLVVGSALNVLIYRLTRGKSPLWPSSRCGACLRPIAWYDNLPILGYLILHGRCRRCGVPFSARYLGVELLTGIGFAGLFYLHNNLNAMGFESVRSLGGLVADEGVVHLPLWAL